jgi:AcrR family transcriptional regulator
MAIEAQLADGRILEFPDGTDPAVIQSTVKRLIAESKQSSAPKPAPSTPVVEKVSEPPKRAPYKNRIEMLDDAVNLLEEGADQAKLKQSLQSMGVNFEDVIKHGQQRGSDYFKQQAPMAVPAPPRARAEPTGTVKATPETKFTESPGKYAAEATGNMFRRVDASLGDIATSYLFQTGVADADAAGRLLARNAKQRAAAAPSQDIREGMEAIGNSKTYGEAISALASNPRATFTMLVESVAVSLPGMVPALVLGPAGVVTRSVVGGSTSGATEYGSVMADVLQDKGVNMLDANAISKALSNPKIIAEMRDKAAKRGLIIGVIDGLSLGVAGKFLKPAQALIAEGKLAGTAAKKATMAAWGKELATQTAGGAGGEFIAQKATGDDKPADVLLEALAGVVTAPLEARSNLRNARMAEQEAAINAELAAQKEPVNMDLGELGEVRPSDDLKETPPPPPPIPKTTPDAVREARVQQEYERLVALGTPPDTAKNMAARRVADAIKAENKTAAIKIPESREEQITQELIAAGVPPQQAKLDAQQLAQEEAQADELAKDETGGTTNIVEPISTPSGESVSVAGQPSAEPATGGVGVLEPSGVVPTGQDVAGATTGEAGEPTALKGGEIKTSLPVLYAGEQASLTIVRDASGKVIDTTVRIIGDDLNSLNLGAQGVQTNEQILKNLTDSIDDLELLPQVTKETKPSSFALTRGAVTPEAVRTLSDEQLDTELTNTSLSDAEYNLVKTEITQRQEKAAPKATPEKATTLYHGTNTQYDTLDPEKSGGMVFFGEDLSTAQRYAQNGGGGRARLDNTQKYIVDRNGVVYELDGETWKAVGVAPEEGLINQDTIQPLDKAYPSLSQAEAEEMTNPDSGTAGVVPKTSRIITQDFSGLKLLDISTPEGRDVIAGLTPTTRVGSDLVDAAKFDARDKTDPDSTTQLNSGFWGITKFSSTYGDQLKKDIIGPLKALGYDGIRFSDDQHSSVGLFDTGLGKTKSPTKTKGTTGGIETSKTVKTTQEGQAASGAGAGKRGRPPVQQRHVVTENSEGGFDHVTDGEVTATYKNKKQAIAAVNLAKAKDRGDTARVAQYQAELDKALTSTGRGRPAKATSEDGTAELSREDKVELDALEAALETYNSPVGKDSVANSAMYISEVANDPTAPKAVRERAKQMLEDDVDPKDIPKKLRSSEAKVAKPDTGFSKLTNGSQAIAHIIKTGNLFQRFVAQRIRNFVINVKFVVVEKGDPAPAQLSGARGLFVYTPGSKERTIYVRGSSFGDQQGINVITVLHELLHAATASRIDAGLFRGFKNASLQKFMREMESLMKRTQEAYEEGVLFGELSPEVQQMIEGTTDRDRTGKVSIGVFSDPHEFLAYGMSSPEFQKFLMSVQGKRGTGFSGFVDSIRDLFGVKAGDATAFTDLVDITDKMLGTRLTKVDTKGGALPQKINYTPPEFDEDADKGEQKELRTAKELTKARVKAEITYQQSADSQKVKNAGMLQKLRDPEKAKILFKGAWKKMSSSQRAVAVRLPTWDFLADWVKNDLPQVQQALDLHNDMKGMTKALLEAAEERIRVTRNAFKADKTLEEKLTQMIYKTTDAQYDPSDTTQKVRDKKFDAEYKALGAKGQELYKMWRDYYVDMGDLFIELLDEQVRGISGLTDEVKSNLAAVIRQTYETKDRIKPFFPFVRDEGDFWLAVGKSSSPTRAFYIYESATERDEDAARIAGEKKQSIEEMRDSGEMELGDDLDALRNTARDSSQLLTSIFRAIDAIKLPAGDTEGTTNAYKENLKDSVYQVFLNTMPEQSFRLMFRHRKGRGGYRTDLIQNTAKTAAKMSVQLARLKYAQKMRNVTSAARDSIVGREHLLPYVKELERRVATVLSPRPQDVWDAVAGVANRVTYLWTLTSASTALIQPISIYVSALPILAANHGFSPIRTAKELGKMITYLNQYGVVKENVDGTHRYVAPSIANAKNLPADEKRAIQAMTRMNVAQSTYVAQVYDYSQTPVSDLESVRGRGKEAAYLITGALMHNMERLTREVVYLASYRLGKQRGLSEADAIKQAADDTREALGDYETTNKPRWMQRGVGRVAFAMKMYPVVMIQQLVGNFLKMLPFFNKEGKKEALAKFIGIYMTAGSIAGLAGIPAYSVLIHGIVAGLKDKVDEEDLPEELKDMDPEMWLREVYMPQKFGEYSVGGVPLDEWIMDGPINAITGWSISSRIGLNDIWAKDGKSTKDVKEAAAGFLAAYFGGPTLSVATSMLDAVEQYMLGDYEKGNEKMMPKPIRDFLLAQKYDIEGIKSATGVELVAPENVKTSEKVGQIIGFAPALTASVKEAGFKMLSKEQDILNERNKILRKLDIQNRKGTDEGDAKFDNIIDKDVEQFNKQYPDYSLKIKDIKKSLKTKEEQRQKAPAGVTTTKKFYGIGDEAISNLEKKLERREKEMEERRYIELRGLAEKNPR